MEHISWRELLGSVRVRAWAVLILLAVAVTAFMSLLIRASVREQVADSLLESSWDPADSLVILLFGLGVVFGALGFFAWMRSGKRLHARCPEDSRVVRFALGGISSARFEVDGHRVTAKRLSVTVQCQSPSKLTLTKRDLRAIGRQPELHPTHAASAAHALELVTSGVVRLEIERDRFRIVGGTGEVARLVRHALEVASAPSKLGLRAQQREHALGCPYCHQPLTEILENPTVRCTACDSVSHTECWKEHGGCAVFACRKGPRARERAPEDRVPAKG